MPSDNTGKTISKIVYGKNFIQVTIEDEVLKLDQLAVADAYLYVGKQLTNAQYEQLKIAEAYVPLHTYLQNILSKGRYTEVQIRQKLKTRKATAAQIDQLITYYKQHQLIHDEALIKEYVEMYASQKLGHHAIIHKLKEKGFALSLIQQHVMAKQDTENISYWIQHFDQKFKHIPYFQKKQKIAQSLLAKGFDYETMQAHLVDITSHEETIEVAGKRLFELIYRRYEKKYSGAQLTRKLYAYLLAKGYNSRMIANWIGGKEDADKSV